MKMSEEKRRGEWLQTYTRKRMYPLDPRPEDIDIMDIAHSLSNICRFTGHTLVSYNVAQHSVMVSRLVKPKLALFGLLHDAAEAYIGDISRPLKVCLKELCGDVVKDIEQKIESCILSKFGVPEPLQDERAEIKRADNIMLSTEARDLMGGRFMDCAHTYDLTSEVLPEAITPWSAGRSRWEFLNRFRVLGGKTSWDKAEKCPCITTCPYYTSSRNASGICLSI
jgi:uncharacterized protein